MFNNSVNTCIKDSSFHIIQNTMNVTAASGLDALHNRVAMHAISNVGGRADEPKCHSGTRLEVINIIERWMDAPGGRSRILWLSGPAGAGKTAIVKTVAERCKDRGVHTANFFFFRGDPTRNIALPLAATLVYQILQLYPDVHDAVTNILSTNPLILGASVDEQFDALIHPLFGVLSKLSSTRPRVVLIVDGLDECDSDANLDQARIIRALNNLVIRKDSPFRVLLVSRPEAHIKMTFNQLSSRTKIKSMFLDDQYSPEKDIRHFVIAEFRKIKSSHPNARSLPHNWPSDSDVEDIVAKSSGQFIFAATVMRYIGHASTVPSLSLQRVKGITPAANNSPFAHLDSIYTFILSRLDDLVATRTILSMKLLDANYDADVPAMPLLRCYSNYTKIVVESCVADLAAIVHLTESGNIEFYHASMGDFLLDKSRSGIYWIDMNAFRQKVLVVLWQNQDYEHLALHTLADLETPTTGITNMLLDQPLPAWTRLYSTSGYPPGISRANFLNSTHRLYYKNDFKTYKRIVRRFVYSSLSANSHPDTTGIPYAQECISRYSWWLNLLNLIRRRNEVSD